MRWQPSWHSAAPPLLLLWLNISSAPPGRLPPARPPQVITSPIRRVTPAYLAQRCPTITEAQSAAIVAGLKTVGLLGEDGYLKADPHEDEVGGWTHKSLLPRWWGLPCPAPARPRAGAKMRRRREAAGAASPACGGRPLCCGPAQRRAGSTAPRAPTSHRTTQPSALPPMPAGPRHPRLPVDAAAAGAAALAEPHEQVAVPAA